MLKLAGNDDSTHLVKLGHQRLKGSLLSKLRRQEEAIDFINGALDEAKAKKDTFGTGMLYYSLATTYSTLNLSQTAVKYIDSSIYYYDLATKRPTDFAKMYGESVGVKFGQTFNLFERTNDTAYVKKLREIISFGRSKNINRPFFVIYPIIESYARKQFERTIILCDTFLNKNTQTKLIINNYIALVVTKYKALSLYQSGKKNDGVRLLESALQQLMDEPAKDESTARLRLPFVYTTSQLLQDFYKTSNNWDKAYRYLSINQAARDTLDFIANQGKIFEANQKYDFAKKEITVQQLEKDNAVNIKERNFALFVTIIALLSFIIIASLLYNSYRRIKLKKKIADKDAQNKIDRLNITSQLQISELEEKSSMAKQEEQKRLGMELHDGLAGDLVFLRSKIGFEIQRTKETELKNNLIDINEHALEIYEKIRNKSHDLFNTTIEESDSSFKKRIQLLIDNGLPDDRYQKNISIDDDALQHLPLNIKIDVLYIIQEVLINIIKHADATVVDILIYEDIPGVVITINDNGKGFDDAASKKGVGLRSIENKLSQMNSTLVITSEKHGTDISMTLPFTMLKQAT